MSVTLMRSHLTGDDIDQLVRGENGGARAAAAHKVCRRIADSKLTDAEREAAGEVLTIMAQDAAIAVRRALSMTLRNSRHLPREVALRLIDDIDEVAAPVLQASPVLSEEDLVAVLLAGTPAKHEAIAGRPRLDEEVVEALVEHAGAPAIAIAVANEGAAFTDYTFSRVLDRHGRCAEVTDAMIDRTRLPVTVAEQLIDLVTDEAMARLAGKHALPPELVVELAAGAHERATIDILDNAACDDDVEGLVSHLFVHERLTPSIVLRAACLGRMAFFEHSLAVLADIPHQRAWLLVHDAGPLGLKAVFERSGLPSRLFNAVRAALEVYHELQDEGEPDDRERFTRMMVQRVLTRHQAMSRDELSFLLDKLDSAHAVEPVGEGAAA